MEIKPLKEMAAAPKIKNFTFKTEKDNSRYKLYGDTYLIKLDKKEVGYILSPYWRGETRIQYKIQLRIHQKPELITKEKPCDFTWFTFKLEFETLEAAKEFIKTNYIKIQAQLNLYPDKD